MWIETIIQPRMTTNPRFRSMVASSPGKSRCSAPYFQNQTWKWRKILLDSLCNDFASTGKNYVHGSIISQKLAYKASAIAN